MRTLCHITIAAAISSSYGCADNDFKGNSPKKPAKKPHKQQYLEQNSPFQSSPALSHVDKPVSHIPIIRECSDVLSRNSGTNLLQAQQGVGIKAYPIDAGGNDLKKFGAPMVFTNDPLGTRQKIIDRGVFSTTGLEGRYHILLCDIKMMASCELKVDINKNGIQYRGTPGYVGAGGDFTLVKDQTSTRKLKVLFSDRSSSPGLFWLADEVGRDVSECDTTSSPLVIDLQGQGIALSPPSSGVNFDIDGDGDQDRISWPNRDGNAFVALDVNKNGQIDDVHELFGNNTLGPDKQTAANGFDALAKHDANHDGVINSSDQVYSQLLLWRDANHDGVSQSQELVKIADSQVLAIDLKYLEGFDLDEWGNSSRQRSVVHLKSGELRMVFDIWFRQSGF